MAVTTESKTLQIYREAVQTLLKERAISHNSPQHPEDEKQLIVDTERDHYQIVNVGWYANGDRNYGCILHVDIKEGKVWIQHDGTEEGFANALVAAGLPKEDIVLGFQDPFTRQYSGFAIG